MFLERQDGDLLKQQKRVLVFLERRENVSMFLERQERDFLKQQERVLVFFRVVIFLRYVCVNTCVMTFFCVVYVCYRFRNNTKKHKRKFCLIHD